MADQKKRRWRLGYNCNDLATNTFEDVTGIAFESRALRGTTCSTPNTVYKSVTNYQAQQNTPETMTYRPRSKEQVAQFQTLEESKKLSISLFEENKSTKPAKTKKKSTPH